MKRDYSNYHANFKRVFFKWWNNPVCGGERNKCPAGRTQRFQGTQSINQKQPLNRALMGMLPMIGVMVGPESVVVGFVICRIAQVYEAIAFRRFAVKPCIIVTTQSSCPIVIIGHPLSVIEVDSRKNVRE